MRPWLKAIIMILVIAALGASGIFVYARLAGNNPVEVTPANYWTLHYMPNQSYIYGIVVSDESQALYKSGDRAVEEIFVHEGDTVHIGDPLLRYDSTKDAITLEEKLLEREKLYNTLQADYAEYKKWARVEYDRAIPTYTPSPSPTLFWAATSMVGTCSCWVECWMGLSGMALSLTRAMPTSESASTAMSARAKP